MSDNQRRVLCRMLFLLACAVPTAVSSYWIFHPQTASGWALAIQAETGIKASIDFVETPSPYETVLHQLRLTDPEHGILLDTVQVRIRFGKHVEVEVPYEVNQLDNRGLATLLKTMHQSTVRRGVEKPWRIRFAKPLRIARANAALFADDQLATKNSLQAMLQNEKNTFVVEELNLEVAPSVDGTSVGARFALASPNDTQSPQNPRSHNGVEIQLKREPQGQAIWLHTFNQALPCWLVSDFAGDITDGLGRNANFVGELRIRSHTPSGQNEVYLDGVLNQLSVPSYPLNVAINNQTQMQITLDECQFIDGQATQGWAELEVPDLRLRSPIDLQTLFQDSRRFVVGNAISTAISNGLNTRIASEPRRRNY